MLARLSAHDTRTRAISFLVGRRSWTIGHSAIVRFVSFLRGWIIVGIHDWNVFESAHVVPCCRAVFEL